MSMMIKELFSTQTGTVGESPEFTVSYGLYFPWPSAGQRNVPMTPNTNWLTATHYTYVWNNTPTILDLGTLLIPDWQGIPRQTTQRLVKQTVSLEEPRGFQDDGTGKKIGYRVARVKYGEPERPQQEQRPSTFSFEITTQNTTMLEAYEQREFRVKDGVPDGDKEPKIGKAIGVRIQNGKWSVDGCQVPVPAMVQQETLEVSPTLAADPYWRRSLSEYVGKVNSEEFGLYAPGEVLLTGVSGAPKSGGSFSGDMWQLTFRYSISRNKASRKIGDITVKNIGGWDYVWALYKEVKPEEQKEILVRPVKAFVAQVYERIDLNNILILW